MVPWSQHALGEVPEGHYTVPLDAAAVLGIEERCGSLAVGKEATLIVSAGDALDMRTNAIRHAFIQGRMLMMDDHHQQLYRMYRDRSVR